MSLRVFELDSLLSHIPEVYDQIADCAEKEEKRVAALNDLANAQDDLNARRGQAYGSNAMGSFAKRSGWR